MIKKEKKQIKRPLAITITAAVLVVLMITTTVILETFINGGFGASDGGAASTGTTENIYPALKPAEIQSFSVKSDKGNFAAKRPSSDSGIFIYYYSDDSGKEQVYLPPVCYSESDFDYTSLYSITNDGFNTHKLTYVLTALGSQTIDNKIDKKIEIIPDERGQYGTALAVYGLDTEHRETISFTYLTKDKDGKETEATRIIYIGNRLVTGTGYYIQFEDVDSGGEKDGPVYVYSCRTAENLTYALEGFASFISPRLIMQGGAGDSTAEPLLTTSYKQWKNVVYDSRDEWGNTKPTLDKVAAGSNLVFTADVLTSIYSNEEDTDLTSLDGYVHSGYMSYQVDLAEISKRDLFKRFVATVLNKDVKSYENDEILATIISNNNPVELNKVYTYKIREIESIITDDAELKSGTVGSNDLVKVIYDYLIDGEVPKEEDEIFGFAEPLHAVIDLSDERIPPSVRNYLRASSVGALSEVQVFDFTYTDKNANVDNVKYIIKDITLIHELKDENVVAVDKITENSIVTVNYQLISGNEIVDEGKETFSLGSIDDKSEEFLKNMKKKLVGMGLNDNVDIEVYETTEYYQLFQNFTTYSIKSIDYYVVREMVSAYKFINPSERDAFYGESIHSNELPADHPYKAYAVDWQSCDYVSKILGGLTAGSSSSVFEGLWGDEVVDVGLTPDNMKEYGLYAYTIYFELPRGLTMVGDEYEWFDTTGFTLYISERNSDGTRYVGSDMYDIIVKMNADTLYWIEEDFIDFWARRDIVMIDQTKLDRVTATVNLKDFYGKYSFHAEHPDAWLTPDGLVFKDPGEDVSKEKYNAINVFVSVSDERDYVETEASKYIDKYGVQSDKYNAKVYPLANIYNLAAGIYDGYGLSVGYDTLGDSSFKDFLTIIYSVGYVGTLSAEESAAAKKNEAVLTLSFYLESSSESNVDEYAYDFYYTEDGRVAVSIYRYNSSTGESRGESCDFYISNFAFKKIVNSLSDLLNGKEIDLDAGYKD